MLGPWTWRLLVTRHLQYASSAGFYVDYQYERAYEFLEWMAYIIHTNSNYRNVGMLEVVNEPIGQVNSPTDSMSMRQTYYPTAWSRIRASEAALNVSPENLLHIQMMVKIFIPQLENACQQIEI